MSASPEAVVRAAFETFQTTGTIEPDLLADSFVLDMSPYPGWPERPTYEGVEGLAEFIRVWVGAWDDYRLEVKVMEPMGDHVIVKVSQRGVAKASGLEVDMEFAHVWTVRGGQIERFEVHPSVESARDAASG